MCVYLNKSYNKNIIKTPSITHKIKLCLTSLAQKSSNVPNSRFWCPWIPNKISYNLIISLMSPSKD